MTCEKCKKTYEALKNTTIDTVMKNESEGILERHAKRKKYGIQGRNCDSSAAHGSGCDYVYCINEQWWWLRSVCGINGFYVVGSIIVSCTAPFYTKKNYKKHLGECNSITSYLLFCRPDEWRRRVYFMDDTNNFWIVCCIFPLVIRNITLPPILSDKKALITLAWDTLWLFLTILKYVIIREIERE